MWTARKEKGRLRIQVRYETEFNFSLTLQIPELKLSEPITREGKSLEVPTGTYTVGLKGLLGDPGYEGGYGSAYHTAYGTFERKQSVRILPGRESVCVFEIPKPAVPVFVQVVSGGAPVSGAEVLIREVDENFRAVRPPDGARFNLYAGSYTVVVSHGQTLVKDVIHVSERRNRFAVDISRQLVVQESNVVVRYLDGRLIKGVTENFMAGASRFAVVGEDGRRTEIEDFTGMKAVFFVKTLEGNRQHQEQKDFAIAKQFGQKTVVLFADGEEMRGFTLAGHADQGDFFLFPVDTKSNNAKVYVIREAVRKVVPG